MNKKKLMAMLLSLCLVMALGVGATLAYFTSKTKDLTNVFTVGKGITASLHEEVANDGGAITTIDASDELVDYTYEDIQPGDELTKKPYMEIGANSNACYAFMKVTGINGLSNFTVDEFSGDWLKVSDGDGQDGIYRYIKDGGIINNLGNSSNFKLSELFTTVTYSADVISADEDEDLKDITILGCAVQSSNLTPELALEQAISRWAEEETE